jgi:ubiquinone/menaquinone biosynthesis C-methylase UbiE
MSTVMNYFSLEQNANNYSAFLESRDGKIQREILYHHIKTQLDPIKPQKILEAGCGTGWLSNLLSSKYPQIQGCDGSEILLKKAKTDFPSVNFQRADLEQPLPYSADNFDAVIMNMVINDIEDQLSALKNLLTITKPGGSLIITLPNPFYSLPTGNWKRGLWRFITGQKPKLMLNNYFDFARNGKQSVDNKNFTIRSYSLASVLNNAAEAGWIFKHMEEIRSLEDDKKFSLRYQLYRFPLLLMLVFQK